MPLVSKTFADIITFARSTNASYFNAAGTLTSAAINEPRLDYNPATLAAQGLLIEEQRVNLLTYSSEFDNAVWTKVNATISANVVASPTGNADADKLIEDTATTVFHTLTGAALISGVSGAAYTLSIFAKPAGRTKFLLQIDTSGFGNGNCIFDVASGTTGALTGTASAPKITPVGNGWYRCSVLMTATGSFTSVDLKVILLNASDQQQYTGDGVSGIYLYGAQLEAGAFATSYIPTTTTALTRAADIASVNTLSPWYNASEGTLYAEGSRIAAGLTSGVMAGFSQTLTFNQSMYIANDIGTGNGLSMSVINGGVTQAAVGGSVVTGITNTFKSAFGYATNNFAGSINGATPVTDVSGTVPTPMQNLTIGSAPWVTNGATNWSGYLRRITYYPRRLSNAELQTLTT